MQRDRKGGAFTVQFAKRLDFPVGGSHSTSTALVPSVNPESDLTQQQQQQRCQRCWKDFRVKPQTEVYNYTCWRCSYPVCRACRVQCPEAMDLWVCTSCVKPMNFMRLFETTASGVGLLLHIMTFCDPRGERIMKFLFPAAALQHVARKDPNTTTTPTRTRTPNGRQPKKINETTRRRQILVRADTVKSRAESSGVSNRRILVDPLTTTTTPPQRMVRAKTAFKRYSPPQQQQQHIREKGKELLPQGVPRRAKTPEAIRSFATLTQTICEEKPLKCSDVYDLAPPVPFEAATTTTIAGATTTTTTTTTTPVTPVTTAAAVHTDPQALQMVENNVVKEGATNKFLRSDVGKSDGLRLDGLGISDKQISPDSIVSTNRSDSPPPRFPSFSQFLDEQEAAQHLEFHHLQQQQQLQQLQLLQQQKQQQQSLNGQPTPGGNSKSVADAVFQYVDVVELGGRGSTWNSSPNPTAPISVPTKGMTTISPEPLNRSHLCHPAPQLRVTPVKVSESISQRRTIAVSGSRATTTRTTTTTARQSTLSTHTSLQKRPARGVVDRNNEVSARLHTSRGHLTRPSNLMKPASPRPFSFSTTTTTTTTTTRSGAIGGGYSTTIDGRGSTHSVTNKMARGTVGENKTRRKEMGITSPRFARKPTARTALTDGINAPQTARVPPTQTTARLGIRSKVTSPLTSRPGVYVPPPPSAAAATARKPKTAGGVKSSAHPPSSSTTTTTTTTKAAAAGTAAAASSRLSRTTTPLARTNTSTRVRNGTPRGAGTRTPLQRITSSRLLPLDDGARRYVPTKPEKIEIEPQVPPPPPLVVHFTRQRKQTESDEGNEAPATARIVQQKNNFLSPPDEKGTCTARSLPPQTTIRNDFTG
ncbi:uncharacterized protein TM35_000281340 [Trypanosoma theileri]|uniref:Uncharacterized protein n=1 Tax=Trypanosoma theileri TaxID=67003 RepID=A0A1X0NPG4_9TRYP|nr:uncharacterized protein TM35_000281340 [Trypanosoma theileri]ORC86418.1 hypothetical protein TM35_000281340 [Trypanosoma theileri]